MACASQVGTCGKKNARRFAELSIKLHYFNYLSTRHQAILACYPLTFGPFGGLTPALLGKTFFSTRRPALETGGQRPTARCALGRKSVWQFVLRQDRG